jgi:hypothetical protein
MFKPSTRQIALTSYTGHLLMLVLLMFSGSCREQKALPSATWVARADNGDKPGVEYRVGFGPDGLLTLDVWLFAADEKGRDSERAQFPVTLESRTSSSLVAKYHAEPSGDDSLKLVFPDGLKSNQETGVLTYLSTGIDETLNFRKVDEKRE